MELDDLKAAWTELDNRLKKNEELKESIILEMINVVGLPLVIPLCIYIFDKFGGKFWSLDAYILFAIAVCFFGIFWTVYKLHGLMKIDLLKNVGNNIYFVNKYNIQRKREKKITDCFVGPVFAILFAFLLVDIKATFSMWILGICVFASCGLFTYWLNKKQNKNIDSILKSLDEIRELKEE